MKYERDLFKKRKKIKPMNCKMTKNTYLSTIESKKQENRDRIMDTESVLMVAR